MCVELFFLNSTLSKAFKLRLTGNSKLLFCVGDLSRLYTALPSLMADKAPAPQLLNEMKQVKKMDGCVLLAPDRTIFPISSSSFVYPVCSYCLMCSSASVLEHAFNSLFRYLFIVLLYCTTSLVLYGFMHVLYSFILYLF